MRKIWTLIIFIFLTLNMCLFLNNTATQQGDILKKHTVGRQPQALVELKGSSE